MESKRKKRQVRKVSSEQDKTPKPDSFDALIRHNGDMVEALFKTQVWVEIVFPLIQESIASVSGRFTNSRFYQGSLTRTKDNADILRGYQMGLEEFYNRLHDFIIIRDKKIKETKDKDLEKTGKIYNPFMEEHRETNKNDQFDIEED